MLKISAALRFVFTTFRKVVGLLLILLTSAPKAIFHALVLAYTYTAKLFSSFFDTIQSYYTHVFVSLRHISWETTHSRALEISSSLSNLKDSVDNFFYKLARGWLYFQKVLKLNLDDFWAIVELQRNPSKTTTAHWMYRKSFRKIKEHYVPPVKFLYNPTDYEGKTPLPREYLADHLDYYKWMVGCNPRLLELRVKMWLDLGVRPAPPPFAHDIPGFSDTIPTPPPLNTEYRHRNWQSRWKALSPPAPSDSDPTTSRHFRRFASLIEDSPDIHIYELLVRFSPAQLRHFLDNTWAYLQYYSFHSYARYETFFVHCVNRHFWQSSYSATLRPIEYYESKNPDLLRNYLYGGSLYEDFLAGVYTGNLINLGGFFLAFLLAIGSVLFVYFAATAQRDAYAWQISVVTRAEFLEEGERRLYPPKFSIAWSFNYPNPSEIEHYDVVRPRRFEIWFDLSRTRSRIAVGRGG